MIRPNQGPLRTSGGGSSTDPITSTTPNVITTTGPATNPQTFLYDVGLQNVYQDYQKASQRLAQQEQQSLQDAYYIREMSKKYLGEYASNVGIGDVSGNLLDIFGQYQQQVSGIRSEFGEQQLGLQSQYESARSQLEAGKLQAETAPTIQGFQDVSYNLDLSYYLPTGTDGSAGEFNPIALYRDDQGLEYYIDQSVQQEAEANPDGVYGNISDADILAYWQDNNSGQNIYNGATVVYSNGQSYVLRDGAWYRMKNTSGNLGYRNVVNLMTNQEANWGALNTLSGEVWDQKGAGFFEKGGKLYISLGEGLYFKEDKSAVVWDGSTNNQGKPLTQDQQAIFDEFARLHPDPGEFDPAGRPLIKNKTAIEYNGKIYFYKDGKIYASIRHTQANLNK